MSCTVVAAQRTRLVALGQPDAARALVFASQGRRQTRHMESLWAQAAGRQLQHRAGGAAGLAALLALVQRAADGE